MEWPLRFDANKYQAVKYLWLYGRLGVVSFLTSATRETFEPPGASKICSWSSVVQTDPIARHYDHRHLHARSVQGLSHEPQSHVHPGTRQPCFRFKLLPALPATNLHEVPAPLTS